MTTPHIGKSRKVREFALFTKSGKPVYSFGNGKVTLEAAEHRLRARCDEDELNDAWTLKRTERAEAQLGEPVEWRFNRETEVMDVYF